MAGETYPIIMILASLPRLLPQLADVIQQAEDAYHAGEQQEQLAEHESTHSHVVPSERCS
jgi:hypothetical protein